MPQADTLIFNYNKLPIMSMLIAPNLALIRLQARTGECMCLIARKRESERECKREGRTSNDSFTKQRQIERKRAREEARPVRLPWLLSKSTQSEINSSNSKITIDFQRSRSVVSQESRRIHK